jgi:penicillin-binding protein 1A
MFLKKILKGLFFLSLILVIGLAIASHTVYDNLQSELPDISMLDNIEYTTPLSIYSADGLLLAQFGEKKRSPINIGETPHQLINAFVSAEDGNFYSHPGVDIKGLIRAGTQLLLTGKKKQGGSTITMQVARSFFLTRKKTYVRKIKEIILALRIEQEYSKDKIMELYLNKIYLGHRSYGVEAAAATYYGKKLSDLNLPQFAMIAGLPKAPSTFNPISNPQRALQRRNYVLRRMHELDHIDQAAFDDAIKQPITASIHATQLKSPAPYVAEMVRKEIVSQYGDKAFTTGLKVYTTIDSTLQKSASGAVRSALHNYDQRHGYRSLPHPNQSEFNTSDFSTTADIQSAQVIGIKNNVATAKLKDSSLIKLSFKKVQWARQLKSQDHLGPELKSISELLKPNDLIRVRQLKDSSWTIAQVPAAEASFVALNAHDGAILALSGGFDFFHNKYNRVTQSKRQPGSGFKPIIYTTALENGFTVASLINDAPVVIADPEQGTEWRPENYSKKFFGMTSLRTALRKSRNLISIRLLRDLGIGKVTRTALRFGFNREQLPNSLSLALGSGHATPLQMATVYSVFANGGFLIKPYFIDRIEDNKGTILFQATPDIACPSCSTSTLKTAGYAPKIISPQINFLMNSLLRDVVQRGTATAAKVLKRKDLAGKTGTTNDQKDAWFNGFSSGIAATAWLGFDTSESLGSYESGGKAALPIWIDFMRVALKHKPEQDLMPPAGIIKSYIDPETGLLAHSGSGGIWEYFRPSHAPTKFAMPEEISNDQSEGSGEEDESLF